MGERVADCKILFVSREHGADTDCGSAEEPFKTLTHALEQADAAKKQGIACLIAVDPEILHDALTSACAAGWYET